VVWAGRFLDDAMKSVKRWRHYCDFCKKSGGQRPAMERHEKGCTANPNRECGLCALGCAAQPLHELIALANSWVESATTDEELWGVEITQPMVDELEKLADYCPACTLAALRQSRVPWSPFKFKEKLAAWWAEYNAAQADAGWGY